MRIYSVYLPLDEDMETRPERAVFIKEGFSWPALIFSGLWFAFHRLWIVLIIYAGLMFLSAWGLKIMDVTSQITLLLHAGIGLLFAFEANELRGRNLLRRGYEYYGQISGAALMEAEEKFYMSWFARQQQADQAGELISCESPS